MSARQWTGLADRGTLGAVPWTRAAPLHAAAHAPAASPAAGALRFSTGQGGPSPPRAPLHAFGVEYVGIYPFGDNGTGHKIPVTPLLGLGTASEVEMAGRR